MKFNLKEVRIAKNMSQRALADMIGVTASVISRYENGELVPTPIKVQAISQVLNVPIEQLIETTGVEDMPYNQYDKDDDCKISVLGGKTQCLSHSEKLFKRFIIRQANGNCELCGIKAPFLDKNGDPHLYVFKIKSKNLNSFDPKEYVAVCSNCADKLAIQMNDEDIAYLGDVAKNHKYEILKEEVE